MFGNNKSQEEKTITRERRALMMSVSGMGIATGINVSKDGTRLTCVGQSDVPIKGAKVTVDRGEAAKRVTATRVALVGIFALAVKKDTTKVFVTVEGADGSAFIATAPAKKEAGARKFAAAVHSRSAQMS